MFHIRLICRSILRQWQGTRASSVDRKSYASNVRDV